MAGFKRIFEWLKMIGEIIFARKMIASFAEFLARFLIERSTRYATEKNLKLLCTRDRNELSRIFAIFSLDLLARIKLGD